MPDLTERTRDLLAFFASTALVGFGSAGIDSTQSGANPLYYYSFAFLFIGIVVLFVAAEHAAFSPVWLFGASFFFEALGWWNVFWSVADLGRCGGCDLQSLVAVANFGPLGGTWLVPLGWFVLGTFLFIAMPMTLAALLPHDVLDHCESY